MGYRVSVDTGGTFTDVVIGVGPGRQVVGKALTTYEPLFEGMRLAMERAAADLGVPAAQVLKQTDLLICGTTLATNAIVEQRTAKTALLTTAGFPDVLVLREGGRFHAHDFSSDYPDPYIPRRCTFEITERVSAEGQVTVPLDKKQAQEVLERVREHEFEALAVSFLWSIANPTNENKMAELIADALPRIPYTLSHQLLPILREYRRTSATAIDASLKPLLQRHLRRLECDIRDAGYRGQILVSTTLGGCMQAESLAEKPIFAVRSGPAMAPVAGVACAKDDEFGGDLIVCDVGGTTFDVTLVRDGRIKHTRETWLGGQWTGHILGISSVDVRSIGAGGGSIAWVDSGGLPRVGPASAGANPGPACYGRGNLAPTVTDAALVLGYLDPEYFLGGRMTLDAAAARRAIETLAAKLGYGSEYTAFAILTLANEMMMEAIAEITLNEGIDSRQAVLVAGGGAAGLTIAPIASELGCRQVLIPRTAAALSASGMQVCDIVYEHALAVNARTRAFDCDLANAVLQSVDAELSRFLAVAQTHSSGDGVKREYSAEARYGFQVWELEVPLPFSRFTGPAEVQLFVNAFHDAHERAFAVRHDQVEIECTALKGRVTLAPPKPEKESCAPPSEPVRAQPHGYRAAYFGGSGPVRVPIYRGFLLGEGCSVEGPAIVEEPTTTVVVYPGGSLHVIRTGDFLLIPTSTSPRSPK